MVANTQHNPIASGTGPSAEHDRPVDDTMSVIQAIRQYRDESEDARRTRIHNADRNWDAFLGRQDWSHKQAGQSTEFLPKVPVSVEQIAAMIKRGLIQFGNYFSIDVGSELVGKIDGSRLRTFLKAFLEDLWTPGTASGQLNTFPLVMSDAVKQALLKNLIILKVHGGTMKRRRFTFERDELGPKLNMEEDDQWKLRIDLVRMEDYYPDPTGNGLYEIHRVERDIHQILQGVEDGIYLKSAVDQLIGMDQRRPEDEKLSEYDRNQDETITPSFRKRVVLDEFWGTLLDANGRIKHRNVVATIANDRFLIRPPEPNPFWHQESPFVVAPLIRVPHSVWHKALYDHATDINLALNELFNLIIDGGMTSVWGVKQVRVEDLEDPSQIEGGIRPGMTLAVKQTLPHNAKVVETVVEGDVPNEAMAVYEMLNREFTGAAMTNELKLGSMPPKQVLATEVLEASQSQNLMLDGLVSDLENSVIGPVLRKSFLVILQNAEGVPDGIKKAGDPLVQTLIMEASPEERFATFAEKLQFKVNGLSATMTRALDFQKIMALLQAVSTNPALFAAFMKKFSPEAALRRLMTALNLNAEDLEKTPEEQEQAAQEMAEVQGAAALLGQGPQNAEGTGPTGVAGGAGTGGDSQTAAIQQSANPASGMPPNIGAM